MKRSLTIAADIILMLSASAITMALFGLALKGLYMCVKFGWNLL